MGAHRQFRESPHPPHGRVGLSGEAAIADYGLVLTEAPDDDSLSHDDSLPHYAATTNVARTARPGPAAGGFLDRGHWHVPYPGGASYAGLCVKDQSGTPFDVDVVGS